MGIVYAVCKRSDRMVTFFRKYMKSHSSWPYNVFTSHHKRTIQSIQVVSFRLWPLGWWWRIWRCTSPLGFLCSQCSCQTLPEGKQCWISCRWPDVTETSTFRRKQNNILSVLLLGTFPKHLVIWRLNFSHFVTICLVCCMFAPSSYCQLQQPLRAKTKTIISCLYN